MVNQLHVYCVYCQDLVDKEQALFIFHTGFYKINIPLAVCCSCPPPQELTLKFQEVRG